MVVSFLALNLGGRGAPGISFGRGAGVVLAEALLEETTCKDVVGISFSNNSAVLELHL